MDYSDGGNGSGWYGINSSDGARKERWAEGTVGEISEEDADVKQVRDAVEGFKGKL